MKRLAAAAIVLLALPFALSDFWTFIAIEVLAFALYAVSFNLLLGYGGMLSFGHAAFFGVGGYAAGQVLLVDARTVVTDGDLLEIRTHIRYLFIDGRTVVLTSRHTELNDAFKNRR